MKGFIVNRLRQGTKVKYRWMGCTCICNGRIEVSGRDDCFIVDERYYNEEKYYLDNEKYANSLNSSPFSYFEILEDK